MRARRSIALSAVSLLIFALAAAVPESTAASKGKKGGQRYSDYRRIPAGSDIVVRVDRDILMRNVRVGDVLTMTLDRDVVVGNDLMVRRGERAQVRLFKPEGRSDEVAFRLITLTVDGFVYDVNSDIASDYAQREGTDGLTVLGKTAVGAATGAALGAIAGGGRGAAIGAGAGAGAGLIWSAATMKDARLPAGTRLRFNLLDPVILNN